MITLKELEKLVGTRKFTANEWHELLLSCPEWVEQNQRRKQENVTRVALLKQEMEVELLPLVQDISSKGYQVNSISEFINTKDSYPDAIPILVMHLQKINHRILREEIARALTVPEAKGYGGALLVELSKELNPETRWALANALTVIATADDFEKIKDLGADPKYKDVQERLEVAAQKASRAAKRTR